MVAREANLSSAACCWCGRFNGPTKDGEGFPIDDVGYFMLDDRGVNYPWHEACAKKALAKTAALRAALVAILAEPYGCSLCDSGEPRNPSKGHQPDCPYEVARVVLGIGK